MEQRRPSHRYRNRGGRADRTNDADDVREEGGRIATKSSRAIEYDLAQLLAGIMFGNLHASIEFGAPAG